MDVGRGDMIVEVGMYMMVGLKAEEVGERMLGRLVPRSRGSMVVEVEVENVVLDVWV